MKTYKEIPTLGVGWEAGDDGSIRTRWVVRQTWRAGKTWHLTGRWRRYRYAPPVPKGYCFVCFEGERYKVHHLILEAFVGPRPPGLHALHGDDDRANNRLDNLRWGSRSENIREAVRNGRAVGAPKGNTNRRLPPERQAEIVRLHGLGWSRRKISRHVGACPHAVSRALGQPWPSRK